MAKPAKITKKSKTPNKDTQQPIHAKLTKVAPFESEAKEQTIDLNTIEKLPGFKEPIFFDAVKIGIRHDAPLVSLAFGVLIYDGPAVMEVARLMTTIKHAEKIVEVLSRTISEHKRLIQEAGTAQNPESDKKSR